MLLIGRLHPISWLFATICESLEGRLKAPLSWLLTPKYYSPSWLAKPTPRGGVKKKPHKDPKVQNGYMLALDKLVPKE